jgi:hypothetical protein
MEEEPATPVPPTWHLEKAVFGVVGVQQCDPTAQELATLLANNQDGIFCGKSRGEPGDVLGVVQRQGRCQTVGVGHCFLHFLIVSCDLLNEPTESVWNPGGFGFSFPPRGGVKARTDRATFLREETRTISYCEEGLKEGIGQVPRRHIGPAILCQDFSQPCSVAAKQACQVGRACKVRNRGRCPLPMAERSGEPLKDRLLWEIHRESLSTVGMFADDAHHVCRWMTLSIRPSCPRFAFRPR